MIILKVHVEALTCFGLAQDKYVPDSTKLGHFIPFGLDTLAGTDLPLWGTWKVMVLPLSFFRSSCLCCDIGHISASSASVVTLMPSTLCPSFWANSVLKLVCLVVGCDKFTTNPFFTSKYSSYMFQIFDQDRILIQCHVIS
jgi:hypothetical protein